MGTPEQIYSRPATRFTAEFIGQTNILACRVEDTGAEGMALNYAGQKFPARAAEFDVQPGDEVCLALRTEKLRFAPEKESQSSLEGTLIERRFAGGAMRATIRLSNGYEVLAMCTGADAARGEVGQKVYLSWNPEEAPVVRA